MILSRPNADFVNLVASRFVSPHRPATLPSFVPLAWKSRVMMPSKLPSSWRLLAGGRLLIHSYNECSLCNHSTTRLGLLLNGSSWHGQLGEILFTLTIC